MAEVFRKKALERRATPEHLDNYINVSNPSVWLILGAIIAFLAGVLAWGVFGSINDVQSCVVAVSGGHAVAYVDESHASALTIGDEVNIGAIQGHVVSVGSNAVRADSLDSDTRSHLGSDVAYLASAEIAIDLPDGAYDAQIVLETVNPVSLLFNNTSSSSSANSSMSSSSSTSSSNTNSGSGSKA